MARSRRPKPGTKDFNEGIYHRPPLGLSFFKTGVLAAIVILILTLLRLHEGAALEQRGLHRDRDVQQRHDPARNQPGADRRRQRRQGDERRARWRKRQGHLHRRSRGPAAARRRDDHDQAAALPRRQLLPRPAAGQPERSRSARRRLDPGDADGDRGRARPGADGRCSDRLARTSATSSTVTARRSSTSRPRRTTSGWTPTSSASPAPRRSTRPSTTAGAPARPPRRSARRCSASRPGTCAA